MFEGLEVLDDDCPGHPGIEVAQEAIRGMARTFFINVVRKVNTHFRNHCPRATKQTDPSPQTLTRFVDRLHADAKPHRHEQRLKYNLTISR